jgi:ABC-type bacteriocin/lantibiotic exporter with double-glycine peptidase domain
MIKVFKKTTGLRVILILLVPLLFCNIGIALAKDIKDNSTSGVATEVMLKKVSVIRVPLIRQTENYDCGAVALQSVLAYYGEEVREDKLIKELGTNPESGTSWRKMKDFALRKAFNVDTRFTMELNAFKRTLDEGKPLIVAIQAWLIHPVNFVHDWENDWDDGHWVVAVGYDDNNIYFMDPSTLGNYTFIPKEEFLQRWHDIDADGKKLSHFGMIVSRSKRAYSYKEVKRID